MKIGILSDIHGNLPALEIALKKIGSVDGYIILGDVVNYGPWSNECVLLVEQLENCVKLLGNHDKDFLFGKCSCENDLAVNFFEHCYQNFNTHSYLKMYDISYDFENYTFKHTIDNAYIFPDTRLELGKNYVIGHSHHQFKSEYNGFYLVNPGSVGQNRKFINEINFMTYEPPNNFNFYALLYNVDIIIQKMKSCNYPSSCINYYLSKKSK